MLPSRRSRGPWAARLGSFHPESGAAFQLDGFSGTPGWPAPTVRSSDIRLPWQERSRRAGTRNPRSPHPVAAPILIGVDQCLYLTARAADGVRKSRIPSRSASYGLEDGAALGLVAGKARVQATVREIVGSGRVLEAYFEAIFTRVLGVVSPCLSAGEVKPQAHETSDVPLEGRSPIYANAVSARAHRCRQVAIPHVDRQIGQSGTNATVAKVRDGCTLGARSAFGCIGDESIWPRRHRFAANGQNAADCARWIRRRCGTSVRVARQGSVCNSRGPVVDQGLDKCFAVGRRREGASLAGAFGLALA